MSQPDGMIHSETAGDEPKFAWVISLAFWLCLLLAASCFAAVSLAPKLLDVVTADSEYRQNQSRLVGLEQRVSYLEKVRDALKNDPAFAAELARIDFDVVRPDDERIAVDPAMSLGAAPSRSSSINLGQPRLVYVPLLELLAEDQAVRSALLVFAAFVTLAAFTYLHEPRPSQWQQPAGEGFNARVSRLMFP